MHWSFWRLQYRNVKWFAGRGWGGGCPFVCWVVFWMLFALLFMIENCQIICLPKQGTSVWVIMEFVCKAVISGFLQPWDRITSAGVKWQCQGAVVEWWQCSHWMAHHLSGKVMSLYVCPKDVTEPSQSICTSGNCSVSVLTLTPCQWVAGVLIGAGTSLRLPSSCLERGRS